jgi:hypothetical protein
MAYPDSFSEATIARVAATRATAERDFARAERILPSRVFSAEYEVTVDKLAKQYIFSVLPTFISAAIREGKEQGWPPDRIKGDVIAFRSDLIVSAEKKCRYKDGRKFLRLDIWDFRTQIEDELDRCDPWLSFLDELAGIANARAAAFSQDPLPSRKVLHDGPAGWAAEKSGTLSIDQGAAPATRGKRKQAPARHRERKRTKRKKALPLSVREKKILAVIDTGAKGMQYCRELGNQGIDPPSRWIARRCPERYSEAYRVPKWAKQIQHEKWRIKSLGRKSNSRSLSFSRVN